MRRKFKRTATLLASLAITVAQIQTPAFAETNTEKIQENPSGTKISNEETGEIGKNNGDVYTNRGVIGENNGKVSTNRGTIKENNKEVDFNDKGTIEKNNENGYVYNNSGTINTNDGTVKINYSDGTIKENNGTVKNNFDKATIEKNNENGKVEKSSSTIETNEGTITSNDGEVTLNKGIIDTNSGYVKDNGESGAGKYTAIITNKGTVDNNNEIVWTNKGNIKHNNGGVQNNQKNITTNESDGEVSANNGQITTNNGGVMINTKRITTNSGVVGNGGIDCNNLPEYDPSGKDQSLEDELNTNIGNFGSITTNNGIVTFNGGKDDIPGGIDEINPDEYAVEGFDIEDYEGGTITTNHNIIIVVNNGTVNRNSSSKVKNKKMTGTIIVNNGTVKKNTAVVKTNTKSGIVVNSGSGVVETNYGKVYNNGGTITTNEGTEYFSVAISSGKNMSQKDKGLTTYDNKKWLGQDGDKQTSTTITVTPSSGYYISGIDVPDEVKSNVSVSRNPDGTWSISISSGTNIALSLPDAIYKYTSSSSDDDDDDRDSQNSNQLKLNNLTVNMEPQNGQTGAPQGIVDNNGKTLDLDLSAVLTSLENKATALNNFSTPVVVNYNDIQGYGMISLSKLFAASSTADTISVPIGANVAAGAYYKVYLSNDTSIDVYCSQSGQLTIPFEKGTSDLTFMICGTALTPPTGNEQSENTSGPASGTKSNATHRDVRTTLSMPALSAGNDFIGATANSLSLVSNTGADGVSSFAQMGGGSLRQETG